MSDTSEKIANLVAAVKSLDGSARSVIVRLSHNAYLDCEVVEVNVVMPSDEGAAELAAVLGCSELRHVAAAGYAWNEHRTPQFFGASLNIEVSGPHRRVDEERAA